MLQQQLVFIALITLLTQLSGCSTTATTNTGRVGAAATDQRSVGTVMDDEIIEINASNALYQDKTLNEQTHVNFTSYNFIVLITGETPSKALKSRIEQIVKSIPKVRRVHNMLNIAAPSSMLSRTSDATLTLRIKTAMVGEGDLAHRVKVVTENGTTYLMDLTSRQQGAKAVSITQQISGVQKIVKLFEYVD